MLSPCLVVCIICSWFCRFKISITLDSDHSFYLKILKEALLRAIQDIDAKFSKASYVHTFHITGLDFISHNVIHS